MQNSTLLHSSGILNTGIEILILTNFTPRTLDQFIGAMCSCTSHYLPACLLSVAASLKLASYLGCGCPLDFIYKL